MSETKTHHIDYLEVDPEIRGQKFVCVSFVEPPMDRFAHKESFIMERFLAQYSQILYIQFCKKHNVTPNPGFVWDTTELYERYVDFKTIEYDSLCKEYEKEEGDPTHMRLFKVRGAFRTYEDAVARCEHLRSLFPGDQLTVSELGSWGPYAPPNFNDIKDIVYTEDKMQQFMKENLENEDKKRNLEEKRKQKMVSDMKYEMKQNDPVILEDGTTESSETGVQDVTSSDLQERVMETVHPAESSSSGVTMMFPYE
jgi:hypothetical protein